MLLVVGAFWGRAGGLILLGIVATPATAGTTALDGADTGHLVAAPRSAALVEDSYRLDIGEVEVYLDQVATSRGLDRRTLTLDVEVGRVHVVVPSGLAAVVHADVSAGDRSVFGDETRQSGTSTYDAGAAAPQLVIDAHVGVGEIDIESAGSAS